MDLKPTVPYADQPAGARLLLLERDALLPLLRGLPAADFDRPTVLPGWSVRDVLAHCAAALTMTGAGTGHGYTAAENQVDVDERRGRPLAALLGELEDGYGGAAQAIAAAEGRLDALALGEWTHGGDVRDALRRPDAYASAGLPDALTLFQQRSRSSRFKVPPTVVRLPAGTLRLGGTPGAGDDPGSAGDPAGGFAELDTDPATLVRLLAGRSPDPGRYQLRGADPTQYVLFG